MKKCLFILSFLWLSMFAFSQAPSGINYQTVIRDGDGQPLAITGLTLKMTIRSGAPDGGAVYVETHAVVSNAFGLVNLVIGQGTPQFTDFSAIRWGNAAHYLETAIDLAGGGQFTILGVTQFVNVPYALYSGQSGGILNMTDQERAAIQNPPTGMQIFNLTTRCPNYYDGYDWFQTCGSLIVNQPPEAPFNISPADGAVNLPMEVNLNWGCSDPENDPLVYDVYFGLNNPPTLMESSFGATSLLVSQLEHSTQYYWKVVAHDSYGNTTEGPVWSFTTVFCAPLQVWAGDDATICSSNPYQIVGASSSNNLLWTTPGDGTFSDPTVLNPVYTAGVLDVQNGYAELTLNATTDFPCPPFTGSDQMLLTIFPGPSVNAGPDKTICVGELVQLQAEATNYSQVNWLTFNGVGMIENEFQLNTVYYPSPIDWIQGCVYFAVAVSPISPCTISDEDEVTICFGEQPTANAGSDQLNLAGTSTTLQGNTPDYGTGQWSIISGAGGSINSPASPTSSFSGQAGNTYILTWTITTACGSSTDDVTISFARSFNCGQSFTDTRDGKVYTTVQIGTQCWMAQNLNIGTSIDGTSNQTNNGTIEKYCYSNTESNCTTYGGLYQWDEMMQYTTAAGVKGICPTGWYLPTDGEWTTLTTYLGGESVAGGKMKETGTTHWTSPNTGATNSSGFTGLPGGRRGSGGTFNYVGGLGYFWSSSEGSTTTAWGRYLGYDIADVGRGGTTKGNVFSVRCVRD